MAILGGIIGLGAALAFLVLAGLVVWGTLRAIRGELAADYRSSPPTGGDRLLALLGIVLPALAAALLAFLGGARIVQVALGLG